MRLGSDRRSSVCVTGVPMTARRRFDRLELGWIIRCRRRGTVASLVVVVANYSRSAVGMDIVITTANIILLQLLLVRFRWYSTYHN